MKRRIRLSIALVLSFVFVTLMSPDSANAQLPQRYVADTGIVTLGPGQILRVTVVAGANSGGDVDGRDFLVWQRGTYSPSGCDGDGTCKHVLASQTTTDPIELRRGEAASMDIRPTRSSSGVRIVVSSSSMDMQLNTLIIDGATGAVVARDKSFCGPGGCWLDVN